MKIPIKLIYNIFLKILKEKQELYRPRQLQAHTYLLVTPRSNLVKFSKLFRTVYAHSGGARVF